MNKEIDTLGTVFGKGLGKSAFQERGNKHVLFLNILEELHWSSITPIPIPLSGLVRHQDRPSDHLVGPVRGLWDHRSLDHRAGTVSQREGIQMSPTTGMNAQEGSCLACRPARPGLRSAHSPSP